MKKALFTLSLILTAVFGLNGFAQDGTAVISTEKTDGPVITIDKDVHDYGTIENGGDPSCVFKVTNTGNAPLIISFCKGSCGCTVPECPKEPIAPGASAEIKVKYDTKRPGPINKSVTITSNAVNSPSKVIRIKGNVKSKPAGGTTTPPTVK